ncbi:MAG: FUSC family protein [Glaciimonas sp.]|nr:FUSC family protein [Glaciimonas sp.]
MSALVPVRRYFSCLMPRSSICMQFDYLGFLNGMAGGLIGCAIAMVTLMIIYPADSRWVKVRLVPVLRRQVAMVAISH